MTGKSKSGTPRCLRLRWRVPVDALLLVLMTSLPPVAGGMTVQAESRLSNPCAGGNPAGPVYPVPGVERPFVSADQIRQSYFIVSQAMNYLDTLLREYPQLNRVIASTGSAHCPTPRLCELSYRLRMANVGCLQKMYQRVAGDIMTIEKIVQAETSYEAIVNTFLSFQMNCLKEALYSLLCDLQNVFEKKEVQLPSLAPREQQGNYLPTLARFQRDYAAFICIRVSLQQTGADLKGLETRGFLT